MSRRPYDPPPSLRETVTVSADDFRSWPVFTVRPVAGIPDGHILYLHGGGHVTELGAVHWRFIARLAVATGRTITVPVFPLAPAHDHRSVYPTLRLLVERLAHDHSMRDFAIAGDSSGGTLALALAQSLPEDAPRPADLVLLSPWLDATLTNPAIAAAERLDPMLSRAALLTFGRLFAGPDDPAIPAVSPINGPLDNLGRVSVFAGTHDLLTPDAHRLRELAATASGTRLSLHEYAGMPHAWMLSPTPEADRLIEELVALLRGGERPDRLG